MDVLKQSAVLGEFIHLEKTFSQCLFYVFELFMFKIRDIINVLYLLEAYL